MKTIQGFYVPKPLFTNIQYNPRKITHYHIVETYWGWNVFISQDDLLGLYCTQVIKIKWHDFVYANHPKHIPQMRAYFKMKMIPNWYLSKYRVMILRQLSDHYLEWDGERTLYLLICTYRPESFLGLLPKDLKKLIYYLL